MENKIILIQDILITYIILELLFLWILYEENKLNKSVRIGFSKKRLKSIDNEINKLQYINQYEVE